MDIRGGQHGQDEDAMAVNVHDVLAWSQQVKPYAPYVLGGAAGLALTAQLPRMIRGPQRKEAHWASWHELKKAQLLSKHGVVVGRIGNRVLRYGGPGHVFVVAASQTGKSRTLKCTLLEPQPTRGPKVSMVVFDPKGEHYESTHDYRATQSRVIRLAPCSRDTDCFDNLDVIRWGEDDEVADVQLLAGMLANPEGVEFRTESERFWVGLSATVIGGMVVHGHETGCATSLGDFYTLVTQGNFYEDVAKPMAQSFHPLAKAAGQKLMEMDQTQYGNVMMTLRQTLDLYADPRIADMGTRSDFALEDVRSGPEPLTIYVCIPFEHLERTRPWVRLFFRQLLGRSTSVPNNWRKRGYHKLLVLGEEFPSLKHLQIAEDLLNQGAGLGVQLCTITPSLNSIEEIWGQHHNFKENSHIQLYFGIQDEGVGESISKRLGDHTVWHKHVTRQSRGGSSVSWEAKKEWLMTSSDITHMDPNDIIIIARDAQVIAQQNPWDQYEPWQSRGVEAA